MKTPRWLTALRRSARRFAAGLGFALVMAVSHRDAGASPQVVNLGSDTNFAVLAGAGIVVATTGSPTLITGDIGSYPTASETGLGNVVLVGVDHGGDTITQTAQADLVTAFSDAFNRTPTTTFTPAFDLGGSILASGVYNDSTSFGITGTLTLDGQGNANSVWIFQAGSTLTTGSGSTILLINGAQAGNVFWEVGTSATLGINSAFTGNIMAVDSITLDGGAIVAGRLLAETATVTMDGNSVVETVVTTPEAGTSILLGSGLVLLFVLKRRFATAV